MHKLEIVKFTQILLSTKNQPIEDFFTYNIWHIIKYYIHESLLILEWINSLFII